MSPSLVVDAPYLIGGLILVKPCLCLGCYALAHSLALCVYKDKGVCAAAFNFEDVSFQSGGEGVLLVGHALVCGGAGVMTQHHSPSALALSLLSPAYASTWQ